MFGSPEFVAILFVFFPVFFGGGLLFYDEVRQLFFHLLLRVMVNSGETLNIS